LINRIQSSISLQDSHLDLRFSVVIGGKKSLARAGHRNVQVYVNTEKECVYVHLVLSCVTMKISVTGILPKQDYMCMS
jgi:hypothetical protein